MLAGRLETAGSLWAKFMGLMGRPSLPAGDGLWLPASNGIHMMFMRFPIDAVFVSKPGADGARTVKSVHRNLRAWTGSSRSSVARTASGAAGRDDRRLRDGRRRPCRGDRGALSAVDVELEALGR